VYLFPQAAKETSMLKIPANVAALAKLAAENPRYAMHGLLVSERPGEGYQVEATDGRRLGVVRGPGAEAERHPRLAEAPGGATEAIIPAKDFAELVRKGKGSHSGTLLVLGHETSTFLSDGKVVGVQNLDGRWPPIDQVFPTRPPAAEFAVGARYLVDLLQAAVGFGDEGNGNVLIRFWAKDQPVAVQTANSSGQSFYGMVMPVSGGGLAPPIEPEIPAWVEALVEKADDVLQCLRKPNGDRLKQVRLADCAEYVDRLEECVRVAQAALGASAPAAAANSAPGDAAEAGASDDPADPAEGDGHERNGQPR
jgi:hypothetical protein